MKRCKPPRKNRKNTWYHKYAKADDLKICYDGRIYHSNIKVENVMIYIFIKAIEKALRGMLCLTADIVYFRPLTRKLNLKLLYE